MENNYKNDIRWGTIEIFLRYIGLSEKKLKETIKSNLTLCDDKFFICQLCVAFFEMLNFKIPQDNEPLKDYVTRDEMKIFLIVSLVESIIKLKNGSCGSKKSVKRFFCDYFLQQDKDKIESKIIIKKAKDKKERNIIFCEFVNILYKIRCNFTHEGEYICQFFYHSESPKDKNFHEYRNIGKEGKFKNIEILETGITFLEFEKMIKSAIKNYLCL